MDIEEAVKLATAEYKQAISNFPKFNSPHEGWAILREEVDELWEEVKANSPNSVLLGEAKQVAAMALRFITDVCGEEIAQGEAES